MYSIVFEHHWICSHLRKTPLVKQGKIKCIQDEGECTNVSDLEDLHDQTFTGTNVWMRNYPVYGELESMKDSWTQKYRSTKTTHTLSWVKQSSCFSTTHCSSKLVCLCSTQSQPSVLLQCLTCSWLDSTLFLTEISGKADSLHIGFITDWELYFHKNYDFWFIRVF